RAYAASAGLRRALLVVVEQAALPYDCPVPLPRQHRGVAMLYAEGAVLRDGGASASAGGGFAGFGGGRGLEGGGFDGAGCDGAGFDGVAGHVRIAGVRQHAGVAPGDAARIAAADLAALAADGREVGLVLGDALAGLWAAPGAGRVRAVPPGQPAT